MTDSERAMLENARTECLSLAVDLEEISAALRVIALGLAEPADVTIVRGCLDNHGDLVVRGQIAWELVLAMAHADDEARA